MRTHSNNFKTKISTPGKMISNKITYTVNGETKTLTDNDLFGISLNNETDLFKTVMQELEFQTKKPIATETIINFQSGVKLQSDVNYDYINYGDFIVNSYEWVAEENNFKQIAYDNMLKTMIEYDGLNVTYPITVRNYINAIATKCGLTFANINDEFANYNREIKQEYFTPGEYTYRDILDYLCEIVGGWMIINSSNELEIKYPTETNETFSKDFLNNMNISFEKKYGPINSLVLSRALDTDNIVKQDQDSINLNGLNELKISDNPFLDNTDRDDYINDIFNKVNGLEYYIMDVSSPGIMYLEPGDLYYFDVANDITGYKSGTIKSGIAKLQKSVSGNYKCLYLNSRIIFSQGLEENIYNREPIISKTDYTTSSPSDKAIRDAVILTNKNAGEIVLKATSDGKLVQVALKGNANKDGSAFIVDADNISLNGKTINLTSDDITIDSEHLDISSSGSIEMNDVTSQSLGDAFISMYTNKDTNLERKTFLSSTGIYLRDTGIQARGYGYTDALAQLTAGKGSTPSFYMACTGSNNANEVNGYTMIRHQIIYISNSDTGLHTEITGNETKSPLFTQTSLETDKKDFEKFENSINIIKNIDIYKYHLKSQSQDEKKHIGFVIGDNYNYSKEVTSSNNDSVDLYSFISVCCQAIKEQQEQIESLQQEINILKERIGK